MIRIDATLFLFMIEFMIIFSSLALFFFLKYRKRLRGADEDIITDSSILCGNEKDEEIAALRDMCTDLREKFEKTRNVNSQLQEVIRAIVPDAEKSDEYKNIIEEFERNNKEIDMCIHTLENENSELDEKLYNADNRLSGLKRKMKDMVSAAEYNIVAAEKKRLEIKVERLKDELENKSREYEKLDKNYLWLEKEYNALYENMEEEKKG